MGRSLRSGHWLRCGCRGGGIASRGNGHRKQHICNCQHTIWPLQPNRRCSSSRRTAWQTIWHRRQRDGRHRVPWPRTRGPRGGAGLRGRRGRSRRQRPSNQLPRRSFGTEHEHRRNVKSCRRGHGGRQCTCHRGGRNCGQRRAALLGQSGRARSRNDLFCDRLDHRGCSDSPAIGAK